MGWGKPRRSTAKNMNCGSVPRPEADLREGLRDITEVPPLSPLPLRPLAMARIPSSARPAFAECLSARDAGASAAVSSPDAHKPDGQDSRSRLIKVGSGPAALPTPRAGAPGAEAPSNGTKTRLVWLQLHAFRQRTTVSSKPPGSWALFRFP